MVKSVRFWVLWVAVLVVGGWYLAGDPSGGLQVTEQLRTLVGVLVAAPVVYALRRAFAEAVRGKDLADQIRSGNVAAGLAYLGLCLLTGLLFLAVAPRAFAAPMPPGAVTHLPTLQAEIAARWPGMGMPSMLGALVEQESGWRERATLKTSREEGVGLGQFTRAYTADGRLRFDALAEVSRLDPSLAAWTWANRYDRSCPGAWCKKRQQKRSAGHRLRFGRRASQAASADRLTLGLSPTSASVSSVM